MKRIPARRRYPDPFLGWASLALRTTELMLASAHVISHRTSRVNTPAQVFAMGSEKAQAALLASQAMTLELLRIGPRAPDPAQWAALLASGLAPFHAKALANSRRALRRR